MRKLLGVVGIATLGLLFLATGIAVYGTNPLPERIPTHFDLSGHPDGYSSSTFIVIVPFVALVLYGLITIVARYPTLTHYPVEVTPENRSRLEHLALGMMAWLKVEMVGIFACIQITLIHAANHPEEVVSLLGLWIMLGTVIVTVIYYVVAMLLAVRSGEPAADSGPASGGSS
ncbi:MAG: DUF1648 domain-containing protein [Terracidiphilus sp.]|jgi:uncharacterized membrane protein